MSRHGRNQLKKPLALLHATSSACKSEWFFMLEKASPPQDKGSKSGEENHHPKDNPKADDFTFPRHMDVHPEHPGNHCRD